MSLHKSTFVIAAIAALFLTPACGGDDGGSTPEEAQELTPAENADLKFSTGKQAESKADDTSIANICEVNGWINDGECDTFCPDDGDDCPPEDVDPTDNTEEPQEPEEGGEVEEPEVEVDPWAAAKDVEKHIVKFEVEAPESYQRASADGFSLGGTEFWQKWEGGHSPTFSFSAGTDQGRTCMQASAIRFGTIMADPPEQITKLKADTNWSGSFFNWNDDYTEASWDGARGAVLWAWRTGLIKWISQTGKDGTCYLPTRTQLIKAAENCHDKGANNDGEIQGCQARP